MIYGFEACICLRIEDRLAPSYFPLWISRWHFRHTGTCLRLMAAIYRVKPSTFSPRFRICLWAVFPLCFLGDVYAPDRRRPVLLASQQVNQFLDVLHTVAIQRFAIRARRHIAGFALQPFVGHNVECWVVQQSIQSTVNPFRVVTILRPYDIQCVTGLYHIA